MIHKRTGTYVTILALLVGLVMWVWAQLHTTSAPCVGAVSLHGQPFSVTVDTRATRAFVTAQDTRTLLGGGSVSIINTATGALQHTVDVGTNPQAVAVDDHTNRAFVLNAGYGGTTYTVGMIDLGTNALTRTLTISGVRPLAIAVDRRTGRVFIVESGPVNRTGVVSRRGNVRVLDARSGTIVRTTPVGWNPGAIVVSETTGRVFVVNNGATAMSPGSVSVLDAATGTVRASIAIGRGPGAIVVDERTRRVFVNRGRAIYVLDARTGSVLRIVIVGGGPLTVDEQTGHVLMVDNSSGTLNILDGRSGTVLHMFPHRVPAGDNAVGMAFDAQTKRLVVIADNADGGSVSILDAQTGIVRHAYLLASDPAAVAVDPHTGHAVIGYVGDCNSRPTRMWQAFPPWLRWMPFLPHGEPPKALGSVNVIDVTH